MLIQKNFKSCCFHELFTSKFVWNAFRMKKKKKKKEKTLKNGSDLIDTKLQVKAGKVSAGH